MLRAAPDEKGRYGLHDYTSDSRFIWLIFGFESWLWMGGLGRIQAWAHIAPMAAQRMRCWLSALLCCHWAKSSSKWSGVDLKSLRSRT